MLVCAVALLFAGLGSGFDADVEKLPLNVEPRAKLFGTVPRTHTVALAPAFKLPKLHELGLAVVRAQGDCRNRSASRSRRSTPGDARSSHLEGSCARCWCA